MAEKRVVGGGPTSQKKTGLVEPLSYSGFMPSEDLDVFEHNRLMDMPWIDQVKMRMSKDFVGEGYVIGTESKMIFGRPKTEFKVDKTENVLALKSPPEKAICGMHYELFGREDKPEIYIKFVQSPTETTLGDYQRAQETLGNKPHEILFANFLKRLAPFLDKRPETDVRMRNWGVQLKKDIAYTQKRIDRGEETEDYDESFPETLKSMKSQLTMYSGLRDRFLDNEFRLNPNRARVKELLGSDNMWIKTRHKRG